MEGQKAKLHPRGVKVWISDFILKVQLKPFLEGKVSKQTVHVYVNNAFIGEWVVNKEGEYQIEIPKTHLENTQLILSFLKPDDISGISLQSLLLEEKKS